jgi:hypothetical protein
MRDAHAYDPVHNVDSWYQHEGNSHYTQPGSSSWGNFNPSHNWSTFPGDNQHQNASYSGGYTGRSGLGNNMGHGHDFRNAPHFTSHGSMRRDRGGLTGAAEASSVADTSNSLVNPVTASTNTARHNFDGSGFGEAYTSPYESTRHQFERIASRMVRSELRSSKTAPNSHCIKVSS